MDCFDIVAGVLQRKPLAPDLLQTPVDLMKENRFTLAKTRSRKYSVQMITDADYADDSVSGKYTCSSPIPAT